MRYKYVSLKTNVALGLVLFTIFFFARAFYGQSISIPGAAPFRSPADSTLPGFISGQVTLSDGKPAAGFRVVAHEFGGLGRLRIERSQNAGEAVTDTEGHYVLRVQAHKNVSPDSYWPNRFGILVDTGEGPYLETPFQTVDLSPHTDYRANNINFTLSLGPQITVRVRNAENGLPVPGVIVEPDRSGMFAQPSSIGVTDAQGELRFRSSHLETSLRLRAPGSTAPSASALVPAPGFSFQKEMQLKPTDDVVWEVLTFENPYRPKELTLRGIVTGPDGHPRANAIVHYQSRSPYGGAEEVTDAQGKFTIQAHIMTQQERQNVLLLVDDDDLTATKFPTLDETWGAIPIHLEKSQPTTVSGRAVDAQGHPLANVPIRYHGEIRNQSVPVPRIIDYTDAHGRFGLAPLYPGACYQITLGGVQDGKPALYGRVFVPPSLQGNQWGGYSPPMRAGEHWDLGKVVIPLARSQIAGRVMDKNGQPVSSQDLLIVVEGEHTQVSVHPEADGQFHVEHVVKEPLTPSAYTAQIGPGTSRSWSEGPNSPDLVCRMPVQAGDKDVQIRLTFAVTPDIPAAAQPPVAPEEQQALYRRLTELRQQCSGEQGGSAERIALLDQQIAETSKAISDNLAALPHPTPEAYRFHPTPQDLAYDDLRAHDLAVQGLPLDPNPRHSPVRDEAGAIQVAKQFLQDTGEEGTVSVRSSPAGTNQSPGPAGIGRNWTLVIQALSQYSPMPAGSLSIDAETGAITELHSLFFAPLSFGLPLTQDQILQQARQIFRATGNPGECRLENGGLSPFPRGPLRGWNFRIRRSYHGIPFQMGLATMHLDPYTGGLISLMGPPPVPDPVETDFPVDRSQAVAAADAALKKAGLPSGNLISATQWVVLSDRKSARVAWSIRLQVPGAPSGTKEVWVDAANSAILQGP